MKKISFLITVLFSGVCAKSQNVGIGTANPSQSAALEIKANNKGLLIPRTSTASRIAIVSPVKGLMVYDTTVNSFWFYNGTSWLDLSAGANGGPWMSTGTDIYNGNTGNVGIGTTTATEKLTIQTLNNSYGISHKGEGGNILATRIGGTSAGIGTFSNTNMRLFANNYAAVFINASDGNVGIGVEFPPYKLDIGGRMRLRTQADGNTAGVWFNDPSNTTPLAFIGVANANTIGVFSSAVQWGWSMNTNTGSIGIGTFASKNKLQIGSLGTSNFAGNDIAFGNGTQATGIGQTATSLQVATTTDIVLLPKYGTAAGRVGINTSTPRAPLDVRSEASVPNPRSATGSYSFFGYPNRNIDQVGYANDNPIPGISIVTQERVLSREFDAFSDERIKEIIGASDNAEDLKIIKALKITNYMMKDKVKYGIKKYKKVIAQDVEKVYPQVVSKHQDFVPNVYQLADKIVKVEGGYRLNFTKEHHISDKAKKLQGLTADESLMEEFEIVAILSPHEVIIKASEVSIDKLFVYGEEVDDFRTIDYEGLAMLNISATQEISRLLKHQQKELTTQRIQIELLTKQVESLKKVKTKAL